MTLRDILEQLYQAGVTAGRQIPEKSGLGMVIGHEILPKETKNGLFKPFKSVYKSDFTDYKYSGFTKTSIPSSTERQIIILIEEAMPEKLPTTHELGSYTVQDVDQIEKDALYKIRFTDGYNKAVDDASQALNRLRGKG